MHIAACIWRTEDNLVSCYFLKQSLIDTGPASNTEAVLELLLLPLLLSAKIIHMHRDARLLWSI